MISPVIATTWLGVSLLLSLFAWLAGRRALAISLPAAVVAAAIAIWVPTGSPRVTAPPSGDYTVLGSKIIVDVGIWVLLDDGKGEPRYYRLKYSNEAANDLQQALDGSQGGKGVKLKTDGEGGQSYDGEPPVTGSEPKQAEAPAINLP